MEVLILAHQLKDYGTQGFYSLENFLKSFEKDQDIKITVITGSEKNKEDESFGKIKIHYINIGKYSNYEPGNANLINYSLKANLLANKIINAQLLLNKKTFDLIHCFGTLPMGLIGYNMYKKYNIPYIINLIGPDIPFYKKQFEYIDKLLFAKIASKIWKESKGIYTESNWLKELVKLTDTNQNIEIINPGLVEIPSNKSNKNFDILFIGKINDENSFINLLRGFRKFSKNKENTHLNIIGYGKKTQAIKDYIKQKILFKKIIFQDYSDELNFQRIYENNTIFVQPYTQEFVNKNILEALSYKMPLMIDKLSSANELLGENGWSFESNSHLEISEKLEEIYEKHIKNGLSNQIKSNDKLMHTKSYEDMILKYKNIYLNFNMGTAR